VVRAHRVSLLFYPALVRDLALCRWFVTLARRVPWPGDGRRSGLLPTMG